MRVKGTHYNSKHPQTNQASEHWIFSMTRPTAHPNVRSSKKGAPKKSKKPKKNQKEEKRKKK